MPDDKSPLGRAKGGIARAQQLTPEKRREIARKAAATRWSEDLSEAEVCVGEARFAAQLVVDGDDRDRAAACDQRHVEPGPDPHPSAEDHTAVIELAGGRPDVGLRVLLPAPAWRQDVAAHYRSG